MAPHGPAGARRCRATSWRARSGIEPGPELGGCIDEIEAAVFAGEVEGRDEAIAHARKTLARLPAHER